MFDDIFPDWIEFGILGGLSEELEAELETDEDPEE